MAQIRIGWIVIAFVTSSMAWAQPPAIDQWARARSPHFTVITTGPAKDAARLARRFERLRQVFGRLWPTARLDGWQVVVVAPVGPAGLAPLLPAHWTGEDAIHPAGLMVAGLDRVYLAMRADQDPNAVSSVAIHEYVDMMVETNVPAAPLWLNEGPAEFYAAGRLEDNPAVFSLPHAGHLSVLRARVAATGQLARHHTRLSRRQRTRDIGVPLCAGLAAGALHEARRWRTLRGAAHDVHREGRAGRAITPGGARAFADLAQLSRRLTAYAHGEQFYDARFPVDDAEPTVAAEGEPLPSWQAAVALGDFITHVQAFDQASELLARAG